MALVLATDLYQDAGRTALVSKTRSVANGAPGHRVIGTFWGCKASLDEPCDRPAGLGCRVAEKTYQGTSMLASVATANSRLIQFARQFEGETNATGRALDQLLNEVCIARISLSRAHFADAEYLLRRRSSSRSAASRYYYSMHSAARALAFRFHGGDQYNDHSDLPKKLPDDLPNRAYWVNELNKSRGLRNDADYDPFSGDDVAWAGHAQNLRTGAADFLSMSESYLRGRGVPL